MAPETPTQERRDWPEVVLCRATRVADPENYGVFHAEHAPAGLSEAETYVPQRLLRAEEEKREVAVEQGGDAREVDSDCLTHVAEAGVAVEGGPGLEQLLGWVEEQRDACRTLHDLAVKCDDTDAVLCHGESARSFQADIDRIRELQGERGEDRVAAMQTRAWEEKQATAYDPDAPAQHNQDPQQGEGK